MMFLGILLTLFAAMQPLEPIESFAFVTEGNLTTPTWLYAKLHPQTAVTAIGETQDFECLDLGTSEASYIDQGHAVTVTGLGGPIEVIDAEPEDFGERSWSNDVDHCLNEEHVYGWIKVTFSPPVRGVVIQWAGGESDEAYGYCYFGAEYARPVGSYYIGPASYGFDVPDGGSFADGAFYRAPDRLASGVTYCLVSGTIDNIHVAPIAGN